MFRYQIIDVCSDLKSPFKDKNTVKNEKKRMKYM